MKHCPRLAFARPNSLLLVLEQQLGKQQEPPTSTHLLTRLRIQNRVIDQLIASMELFRLASRKTIHPL